MALTQNPTMNMSSIDGRAKMRDESTIRRTRSNGATYQCDGSYLGEVEGAEGVEGVERVGELKCAELMGLHIVSAEPLPRSLTNPRNTLPLKQKVEIL